MPTEMSAEERGKFKTWWKNYCGEMPNEPPYDVRMAWQACLAAQQADTQALVAAAEQAALERAAQHVEALIGDKEYSEIGTIRTIARVYRALARELRSLSTGNALDLERAKARLHELNWASSATAKMIEKRIQAHAAQIAALSGEAAASMGIQLDAPQGEEKGR